MNGFLNLAVSLRAPGSLWLAALRRYVSFVVPANFIWEVVQLPLYTIWKQGAPGEIAFAVVHCTGGDALIAAASLLLALLMIGRPNWPREGYAAVAVLTVTLGAGYTVFSEWLNVVVRTSWAYSEWMPVVPLFGLKIGLSPLLQWLVIPAAAFALAARLRDRALRAAAGR